MEHQLFACGVNVTSNAKCYFVEQLFERAEGGATLVIILVPWSYNEDWKD